MSEKAVAARRAGHTLEAQCVRQASLNIDVVVDAAKVPTIKLNASNYLLWASQVEWLPKVKGLKKYVSEDIKFPKKDGEKYCEVMKEKDSVGAIVHCMVETEIAALIMGETILKIIWEKLAESHKSKCAASVHTLRNRPMIISMNDGEAARQSLIRICDIEREFAFAVKQVDKEEKKYALLNGIRAEFEVKITIFMKNYAMSFERMVSSFEQTVDMCTSSNNNAKSRNNGSLFCNFR